MKCSNVHWIFSFKHLEMKSMKRYMRLKLYRFKANTRTELNALKWRCYHNQGYKSRNHSSIWKWIHGKYQFSRQKSNILLLEFDSLGRREFDSENNYVGEKKALTKQNSVKIKYIKPTNGRTKNERKTKLKLLFIVWISEKKEGK